MKYLIHIASMFLFVSSGNAQAQDCVTLSFKTGNACVSTIDNTSKPLKRLKNEPSESLTGLFYAYFAGSDFAGYKQLFLASDWFGLSKEEFDSWRTSIQNSQLEILSQVELTSSGRELGILKFFHIMEEAYVYETFFAKKVGNHWRPVSMKEEQDFSYLTDVVLYVNMEYLSSLATSARQSHQANDPSGLVTSKTIHADKLMELKNTVKVNNPVEFKQHFNNEFQYLSHQKYDEDRTNDSKFIAYLGEMQLTQPQVDIVMKYILAQDFLEAAKKADVFSSVSYVYAPYVDKIREIYGRDRLRKWDSVNQKWD